jgi:hypothetical protein
MTSKMTRRTALATIGAGVLGLSGYARAEEAASIAISVKNQQFQPAEIRAPANRPIVLRVKNLDAKPIEFESVSLRVEKVVAAGSEGVINLRPLKPGRYTFFDDFNSKTTGTLVVE